MTKKNDFLLTKFTFININGEAYRRKFPKHGIQVFDVFLYVFEYTIIPST